jgi:GTPase involved in cell partitioning and DNA repair
MLAGRAAGGREGGRGGERNCTYLYLNRNLLAVKRVRRAQTYEQEKENGKKGEKGTREQK